MDRFLFNEIMSCVPIDEELKNNGYTLPLIGQYANLSVNIDEEGNLSYMVNIDELLNSDITSEELLEIKTQGWEVDNEYLFKKIT